MRSDLHVHSDFSDGFDSVEIVLDKAEAAGIKLLSFVDHDTTDTFARANKLAKDRQIKVIPGIEISAYDFKRKRKVHVLGYKYNKRAIHITDICDDLLERRQQQSYKQLRAIEDAGYKVKWDKLLPAINTKKTLYKQQIMRAITDKPYETAAYQELYRSLFKRNGVASGDIEYIDVYLAVKAIKADGGIAVIAHPGQLDSFEIIEDLISYGLDGVEVYHPDHSVNDIKRAQELAERHELWQTGGSDYHGEFWIDVPFGSPSLASEFIRTLV